MRRSPAAPEWIVLGVVALALGAVLWTSIESADRGVGVDSRARLTRPLRLESIHPGAGEELVLGLRVHHYRVQPRGEAAFLDLFYDTDGWDLIRRGYSYRFRMRREGSGSDFSVRLEREPRFLAEGEEKLDLSSDLPDRLGGRIATGAWEVAVTGGRGIEAAERLRELLRELGIAPERLAPRLQGELRRERFDVTDKGQSWFELDRELWSFRLPTAPTAPGADLEDFVLDTRLAGDDPELFRRVHTMAELGKMFHNLRPAKLAPHERAAWRLARVEPR